jgi:ribosomal protein S18 acetylase RimI-like enzyme
MEVQVIKANETHFTRITELWIELMNIHKELDSQFFADVDASAEQFRKNLKNYSSNQKLLLVLVVDGLVEGFLSANIHTGFENYNSIKYCEVEDVMVNINFRSLGYGKRLIEEVLSWSTEQGVVRVRLSVFSDNIGPLYFFKDFGFKEKYHHLEIDNLT